MIDFSHLHQKMLKFIFQSSFRPEKDMLFLHKHSHGEQTPEVLVMKITSAILLEFWEILKTRILKSSSD